MTLKRLFWAIAVAWALLWLASGFTIGGVMGSSIVILSVYIGMAFAPPALLYVILFWAVPRIVRRFRVHNGQVLQRDIGTA